MVPRRFRRARAPLAVVVLAGSIALGLLPGACSKVPLVAPSGTVITLLATTNVLPINGSTDIIAVLVENGQQTAPTTGTPGTGTTTTTGSSTGTAVHNGTLVSFTTSLGRIEPAEAKTDGGRVIVKLVGDGRSGVATVTAYSGGASKTLTVNIGAAAATRILVTASPQALPSAGGTTTISATVQDQQGNPIAGVPVSFSTTAGSLGVTSGVTDSLGNATTTLSTTAAATVTASAGGGSSGTLSGTVAVTVQPKATVTLTTPTTLTASAPAIFTVGVGSNVSATGVIIDFGDGEKPTDLGPISQSQTVTHMYGSGGRTYKVTVTATFADGTVMPIGTDVVVADWDVAATCSTSPGIPNTPSLGSTTFTATASPAGVLISTYTWTIEDDGPQTRTGNPVTYSWQARGNHIVQLDVTPAKGATKHRTPCSVQVN